MSGTLGVAALVGVTFALAGCDPSATASTAEVADDVASEAVGSTVAPSQPEPDPIRGAGSALWDDPNSIAEGPIDRGLDGAVDVAIIGDSLTVSAVDEITAALGRAGVTDVAVDAVEGRRIAEDFDEHPSGLTAIEQMQDNESAASIDLWVIALGTNDVGAQADAAEIDSAIDAVLDEVGTNRPVVWIDVFVESKSDASADFGVQVRRTAAERGDMVVADWFHPAQRDGALVGDGVHLSDAGRDEFAATVASGVTRLLPAARASG